MPPASGQRRGSLLCSARGSAILDAPCVYARSPFRWLSPSLLVSPPRPRRAPSPTPIARRLDRSGRKVSRPSRTRTTPRPKIAFGAPTRWCTRRRSILGLARALAAEGKYVEAQESYNRMIREGLPAGAPDVFKRALDDAKKEVDARRGEGRRRDDHREGGGRHGHSGSAGRPRRAPHQQRLTRRAPGDRPGPARASRDGRWLQGRRAQVLDDGGRLGRRAAHAREGLERAPVAAAPAPAAAPAAAHDPRRRPLRGPQQGAQDRAVGRLRRGRRRARRSAASPASSPWASTRPSPANASPTAQRRPRRAI